MSSERIEFSLVLGNEQTFPAPYPAAKDIPDWYKAMPAPAGTGGVTDGTVKNCPPFLDAMTSGYLMPLVADINLSWDPLGRLQIQAPMFNDYNRRGSAQMVTLHKPAQLQGTPFERFPVLKI